MRALSMKAVKQRPTSSVIWVAGKSNQPRPAVCGARARASFASARLSRVAAMACQYQARRHSAITQLQGSESEG